MAVSEGQEEVVVSAGHYCTGHYWCFNCAGRVFSARAIYIYIVLMKKDSRYTHLQTLLVLILFLGVLYWFTHRPYLLLAAGLLAVIGLVSPSATEILHKAWMGLSRVLGFISGTVFLSLVFFIIITPLGLFYRKFRKPGFRSLPHNNSSFINRDHLFVKEDLEDMW